MSSNDTNKVLAETSMVEILKFTIFTKDIHLGKEAWDQYF